jgi:hypothetical protein
MPQTVGPCGTVSDFLAQIARFEIVSIGVVVFDGQTYTTHQVNMTSEDMLIASHLWGSFASSDYSHQREH